ncbi:MAG: dephospho-CoA kinase [Bacteriovoracales bacterium]|nr:dephospho-CoA kinase [Bacteriovoracales bacterium]
MVDKKDRLYKLDIPLWAVTGGMGSGKSTVTAHLKALGHPCLEADGLIKLIYRGEETKRFIASLDPRFIKNGQVDFAPLRQAFWNDEDLKKKVSSHLYERIKGQFLSEYKKLVPISHLFYEIPLLFEFSLQDKFDGIITVDCPKDEQIKRISLRDGIPRDLAAKIISSQVDREEKKRLSHYILDNSGNPASLLAQTQALLDSLGLSSGEGSTFD